MRLSPWSALLLALPLPTAHALDLMEAWQAAREHDPRMAMAQSSLEAGRTQREQARALWRPSVSVGGGAGVRSLESNTHGAYFAAPGMTPSRHVTFKTSIDNGTATQWNVTARQPLIHGERSAQSEQLTLGADAAEVEWLGARQELMLQVVESYFQLVVAERRQALLRRQLEAVERALAEAKDRYAAGDLPILDTHEATARARTLQAQLVAAESEREVAQAALADATGLEPERLDPLPPSASVLSPEPLEPLAHWQEAALAANPLLRQAQAKVEIAHKEVEKYRAAADATVDLVAQAGRDYVSGDGDYGSSSVEQTQHVIGVQVNIPLYTGGLRSAKRQEALKLEDRARAELEWIRQQVGQQVRAAWLALQTAHARVTALEEAVTASEARRDATRLGHEVGDRTTLDLLNAENDLDAARLALLQARTEVLQNRLKLQALAGRLDEERLAAVDAALQR